MIPPLAGSGGHGLPGGRGLPGGHGLRLVVASRARL